MYYMYMFIAILYWGNTCFGAEKYTKYKYQPIITGILTNLSTIDSTIPKGLIPIDQYNHYNESYNMTKINPLLIKNFLDKELQRHCINPEIVTYLVGTGLTGMIFEQDWQFIRFRNGYGLIIPEYMPSIANQAQRLLGLTKEVEPTFELNIKNLSNLLSKHYSEKNRFDLAKYRLAITKAIIKTISQGDSNAFIQLCTESAWAKAIESSATISQELNYALQALYYVYGYVSGYNTETKFQQALDIYILNSIDTDLIQTHIVDLEEQLAATKGSYASKLLAYLPLPQGQLEQRINIFKKYLDGIKNSFEIQMLPKFLNKSLSENSCTLKIVDSRSKLTKC